MQDKLRADQVLGWHIVSYPRSGNHLVRSILEANSQRPTEGCLGVASDPPIYTRTPNRRDGLIQIRDSRPIGFKAHYLREVFARSRCPGGPNGLIFIHRNPVDAIGSQLLRSGLMGRDVLSLRSRKRRKFLEAAIENYLSLIYLYRSWDMGPRLLIHFEHLVQTGTREGEIDRLLAATNVLRRFGSEDTDRLYALADDSQITKLKDRAGWLDKAKSLVLSKVSPADLEQLLNAESDAGPFGGRK